MAVGAWPLIDHERIKNALLPFRAQLRSGEKVFVLATGTLLKADYDLLDEGLVQGFVTIDFAAMGEASYHALKQLRAGKDIKEYWRIPVERVTRQSQVSHPDPDPQR